MNATRRSRRLGIFEARALHDDRCLRQLFIPCQVTKVIADKLAEEAADNVHYVPPPHINTWNLTGGKGNSQL